MGRRFAQHVELAGVLHVVQLVDDAVLPQPLRAELELGRGPPAGVRFVELVDVHRRHTIADQDHCSCPGAMAAPALRWEGSGERRRTTLPPCPLHRKAACRPHRPDGGRMEIDRSLPHRREVAAGRRRPRSGPGPPRPRTGPGAGPPSCPTPCDLVEHLRRATGRAQREEAARLIRVLLREADADPFICRMLVQALVPGLVTVAGKLQWGRGGEWQDGEEFFGELLATTWLVLQEWSGQDRPYAVLDLLSAIRCRLRRQLFRSKDRGQPIRPVRSRAGRRGVHLGLDAPETDLEELARLLIDQHREGMRAGRRAGPLRPPCPGLLHRGAERPDRTRPPLPLRPA